MGVMGVNERLLQQFLFVTLLLSFQRLCTVSSMTTHLYQRSQLQALQAIWGAWNTSTNLTGWSSTQEYPCTQFLLHPKPGWRGVQCLTHVNCFNVTTSGDTNCYAFIIGLTLNDASITGLLPPEIGNIGTLSTLKLTGNPNLTGPLPTTLQTARLFILDLHDNGLEGNIPDFYSLYYLLELDLSGNRLNGSFPFSQTRAMKSAQILNLGRNQFEGDIPELAFQNMTELNYLDISNNLFRGILPILSGLKNLQMLDVSSNKFNGTLPNLSNLTSLQTVNLSSNQFSGSFELGSLFNGNLPIGLTVLDLSGNQLTGSLTSWNKLELGSLTKLYLDNNFITGTLDITDLL